jgi:hypothetical protein
VKLTAEQAQVTGRAVGHVLDAEEGLHDDLLGTLALADVLCKNQDALTDAAHGDAGPVTEQDLASYMTGIRLVDALPGTNRAAEVAAPADAGA